MPKLVITRGLPGSGKTTLAKAWVAEQPDKRARVNRDDLRDMLQGGRLGTAEQEDAVTAVQQTAVRELLRAGMSVVCDDTNLVAKHARRFATTADRLGVEFEVWDLSHVSLDECLRRDQARTGAGQVGENVIRVMYERHIKLLRRGFPALTPEPAGPVTDLSGIRVYVQPAVGAVPDAVLVDLDGTAALMGHRSPYDYASVGADAVNEPVRDVVHRFAGDHDILFVSGRDAVCRADTEAWLAKYYPELDTPELFMRGRGDGRPDWLVKYELFQQHIAGRYRVCLVLDDRDAVVRMWRAMGLTVFQVAEGKH
jgi:predicted kinase